MLFLASQSVVVECVRDIFEKEEAYDIYRFSRRIPLSQLCLYVRRLVQRNDNVIVLSTKALLLLTLFLMACVVSSRHFFALECHSVTCPCLSNSIGDAGFTSWQWSRPAAWASKGVSIVNGCFVQLLKIAVQHFLVSSQVK